MTNNLESQDFDEKENPISNGDRCETWMDLMGDNLQMKIISQDDSIRDPKDVEAQDAVVVDFVGRCSSERNDETGAIFHEVKNWIIIVGDKDVTPALEMGIRFMKEGERSVIFSHSKFAYGPMQRKYGSYDLPPNSDVIYHVHVKSVISDDSEIASHPFQLELARNKKIIGNDVYANEWSDGHSKNKALLLYKKAGDVATNLLRNSTDNVIQKEATEVLIDCLNNTAAVHMRLKDYSKAKESASLVLLRDPDNLKALLRAAKAAMLDPSCSFEESNVAIAAATQVDAEDLDVKKLRAELQRRKRDYNEKTKEMMQNMSRAMKPSHSKNTTDSDNDKIVDDDKVASESNPTHETEERLDQKLDQKAQTWVSYLPFIVQFVILLISFFWVTYQRRKVADIEQ